MSRHLSPALVAQYETQMTPKTILQRKLHEWSLMLQGPDEGELWTFSRAVDCSASHRPSRLTLLRRPLCGSWAIVGGTDATEEKLEETWYCGADLSSRKMRERHVAIHLFQSDWLDSARSPPSIETLPITGSPCRHFTKGEMRLR